QTHAPLKEWGGGLTGFIMTQSGKRESKGGFTMRDDFELVRGSGNVFSDFGHVNASVEQARAILAAKIIRTLDERGLSTREAERLTGVSHSEFSRIRNARLGRFTRDRMITILGKLDEDVEVDVTFKRRQTAQQELNS
ncbi:helix-turn-helix domain-containing protein, partial [Candidatus Magnetominusculus xianensis]